MMLYLLFSRTNTGLVQNHGVFTSFEGIHAAALKIMGPNAHILESDDWTNTEYRANPTDIAHARDIFPLAAWIRPRVLDRLYNDEFALSPSPSA